ncbi:hypothetical protein BC332_25868 [Capsicum chinense]|nr:hypothetical protein BC332_25868 [Capsicum chinense]
MELQLQVLDRTLTMDLPNAMVNFPYSTVSCAVLKRERFCPSASLITEGKFILMAALCKRRITLSMTSIKVQKIGMYTKTGPQRVHCSHRPLGELFSKHLQMHRCRPSSRGKVVVIVIVVSSVIVLRVGDFIGISVWKNKQIQKKRKGENGAEKLVEILHDISLNFNYSILDKATRSFDEANKLGFDISKLFVAS